MLGVASGVKFAQLEQQGKIWRFQGTGSFIDENIPIDNTPTLKTEDSFFVKEIPKQVENVAVEPRAVSDGISAVAYIVGDVKTGKIYLEKNSNKILPFASMSKLITAMVATNIYSNDMLVTITKEATDVSPDSAGLTVGEIFTVKELLLPLLLNSSNVTAEALASSTNREQFIKLMSSYSWEVGMPESFIADPSGLGSTNSGTARGFFGLARYLYRERQDILSITKIPNKFMATTTSHKAHNFTNIHPFVSDSRFLGGKTGYTDRALYTMLTILKLADRPIAFIVLQSENRARDTSLLIEKFTQAMF